jgi:hypothetical protein
MAADAATMKNLEERQLQAAQEQEKNFAQQPNHCRKKRP